MMESCANNAITDLYVRFAFTDCVEHNDSKDNYASVLDSCASSTKITSAEKSSISSCWDNTAEGIKLEHANAVATPSDHQYVPWVVVDGVHDDTTQNAVQASLWDYVCSNYKGSNKSADCAKEGFMSIPAPVITPCLNE